MKAGTHDVAVTFIERARVESDEFVGVLPGDRVQPRRPRAAAGGRRAGRGAVQLSRRVGHAEPAARLRLPSNPDRRAQRRADVRPTHRREPGPPRVPPPGDQAGRRIADAVLRERTEGQGRIRCRHRAADRGRARQPRVPLSRGSRARAHLPGNQSFPLERSRAGLAAVVLPLESGAGRGAARRRRRRQTEATPASCARRRCGCCRIRARRVWCATSRSSGWTSTSSTKSSPIRICFRPSTTSCGRTGHRDRVVHGERPARGSQRRRPAHRRPHVPQRAAGAALRHHLGARSAVPPRDAR